MKMIMAIALLAARNASFAALYIMVMYSMVTVFTATHAKNPAKANAAGTKAIAVAAIAVLMFGRFTPVTSILGIALGFGLTHVFAKKKENAAENAATE